MEKYFFTNQQITMLTPTGEDTGLRSEEHSGKKIQNTFKIIFCIKLFCYKKYNNTLYVSKFSELFSMLKIHN